MKKILILLLSLSSFRLYAQTATETDTFNTTETVMVDSTFGSLDTNRISTKYLLERVPVNFGVNHFNGLDASPVDSVKNTFTFYSIYASVYLSQVSGHAHFTVPLTFDHNADSEFDAANDTALPVMMFIGVYNNIDTKTYE